MGRIFGKILCSIGRHRFGKWLFVQGNLVRYCMRGDCWDKEIELYEPVEHGAEKEGMTE